MKYKTEGVVYEFIAGNKLHKCAINKTYFRRNKTRSVKGARV